jgi:hypothetical protein
MNKMSEILQWGSFLLNCLLVPIWIKLENLRVTVSDQKEWLNRIQHNCDAQHRRVE